MKKALLLLLLSLSLFGVDYAQRSTQELLVALSVAKGPNLEVIKRELRKRVPLMSEAEKKAYEKALEKAERGH